MGQKASRALASRLEKGMQQYRHEMEQDIRANIAEKQRHAAPGGYTDPNAIAGFTRGASAPIRQDSEQEAFLQSQQQEQTSHEMPDDLIQFLNDMGPVQRRERKPKLRQHQLEQLEQQQGRTSQRHAHYGGCRSIYHESNDKLFQKTRNNRDICRLDGTGFLSIFTR